jgi:hypothetical protein
MALHDYFEPVYVQSWQAMTDGFGGVLWGWADGVEINVGFILDQSIEARVAEAQGIKSIYTIVSMLNSGIENNDVIRRIKDGAFYQITSDFNETPMVADVQFKQASAEKVLRP